MLTGPTHQIKAIKSKHPQSESFKIVKQFVDDKLTMPKLYLFQTVARIFEPFLKIFESANPLMPCVPEAIERILRQLMVKVIMSAFIDDSRLLSHLIEIDVNEAENKITVRKVDVWLACNSHCIM